MKLYIVIPQFIMSQHLKELAIDNIKSLRDTCSGTIISCDDKSPDETEFLKDISDVFIRNEENKGFAGNCNVGFNWIFENEPEDCYILCINNDITVEKGWFEELKKAMEYGNGAMVGGLGHRFKGGINDKHNDNYISEGGRIDDWLMPGGMWMSTKKHLMEIREKRDGILQVFDENFKHGGYEDIDLFIRFKNAGKRLIMTPKVWYWHFEGATRFSEREKGIQDWAEPLNKQYFMDKWKFQPHQNILDFMIDNRLNF